MVYLRIKRISDLLVSFTGLILLIPLFIALGFIIKLNDKGPLFFRQRRVGKGGKIFTLYKFRSMRFSEHSGTGIFEPGNSCRVTPIGKFIRKTKLDELPQLFNVLIGDMSLVGPRPEVEKWVAVYPEKWHHILTVKPGITDNASIVFRDEEDWLSQSSDPEDTYLNVILPRKLELYIQYVNNHTFFGDMRIIFHTVIAVMFK
jgi:lipopolysaccharide/colanic/teichoic acid biosynthesis glycosyltransferase